MRIISLVIIIYDIFKLSMSERVYVIREWKWRTSLVKWNLATGLSETFWYDYCSHILCIIQKSIIIHIIIIISYLFLLLLLCISFFPLLVAKNHDQFIWMPHIGKKGVFGVELSSILVKDLEDVWLLEVVKFDQIYTLLF